MPKPEAEDIQVQPVPSSASLTDFIHEAYAAVIDSDKLVVLYFRRIGALFVASNIPKWNKPLSNFVLLQN